MYLFVSQMRKTHLALTKPFGVSYPELSKIYIYMAFLWKKRFDLKQYISPLLSYNSNI